MALFEMITPAISSILSLFDTHTIFIPAISLWVRWSGGVYKGLKELGKSTVYASFDSFIEFVADPKNGAFRCTIQRGDSQTIRIYVFQVLLFASISKK